MVGLKGGHSTSPYACMQDKKRMNQATIAAIDIGSNTVHLAVGVSDGEELTVLADESELLQLGQDVANSGRIPEAKIKRAVETLRRFQTQAEQLGAEAL